MNVIIEKCIDKKNSTILCDYYAVNEREREYENKRGENNYIFANSPTAPGLPAEPAFGIGLIKV